MSPLEGTILRIRQSSKCPGKPPENDGFAFSWKRRLGADKDSDKLDSQSPKNFADRVKIPVLLIHCDHDSTVNIDQSEIEERALKRKGKQVEFVRLEGDDHNLEFAETRTRMLKEMERFPGAHIGNSRTASPAQAIATVVSPGP